MKKLTQTAKVKVIRDLLLKNDHFLEWAICILHEYQTVDEKWSDDTYHANQVGFNKPDAPRLSLYSRLIRQEGRLHGEHLIDARKRMIKYAGQLAKAKEFRTVLKEAELKRAIPVREKPTILLSGSVVRETEYSVHIMFEGNREVKVSKSVILARYGWDGREERFLIENWYVKRKITPKSQLSAYV